MSEVYVVQEPPVSWRDGKPMFDLSNAERYGTVRVLFPRQERIAANTQPTVAALRTKLKNYRAGDFLVPVGDPALIAMAMMVAAELNHGRVDILRWDRHLNDYHVLRVDAKGKPIMDEV